ncbi:MAG TPA: hypothetical protein VK681_31640, partial [Reyranella sp.]|nr:hypothetical protein [Reyranella sp.]
MERSGRSGIPGQIAVVAFTDRFSREMGRPPSFIQAGTSGAVVHDPKAVLAVMHGRRRRRPSAGAGQGYR